MTNKELQEKLKEFPEEAIIMIMHNAGAVPRDIEYLITGRNDDYDLVVGLCDYESN